MSRWLPPRRASDSGRAEPDAYAHRARSIVDPPHQRPQVIAMSKSSRRATRTPGMASVPSSIRPCEFLRAGIHLVVLDLFPPGPRDPQGIHKAIWDEIIDNDFVLPPGKPLTLASYIGGPVRRHSSTPPRSAL